MKLSEAIRLGAMLLPQCNGYISGRDYPTACCAVGGAALAVGFKYPSKHECFLFAREQWPILIATVAHPHRDEQDLVENIINSLNYTKLAGGFGWTRERIAAWVATVEPQEVEIIEPVQLEQEAI